MGLVGRQGILVGSIETSSWLDEVTKETGQSGHLQQRECEQALGGPAGSSAGHSLGVPAGLHSVAPGTRSSHLLPGPHHSPGPALYAAGGTAQVVTLQKVLELPGDFVSSLAS